MIIAPALGSISVKISIDPGRQMNNVWQYADPGLLVSVQRFASLSPAWLAACCATADLSLRQCAMLSGTNSVLKVLYLATSESLPASKVMLERHMHRAATEFPRSLKSSY